MADEQLRLVASVTDQFSAPLRNLRNQLQQVGRGPSLKDMSKDWQGVSRDLGKVTNEIRTGLAPALSGIGLSSLGIGGAMSAAVLAVRNFAGTTRDLNMFSKSIGLSVDQLRELKAVGEHFGVGWDQAQGSLKTFAGNLDQIHRRWGAAYGQLRAMNLGSLAEELVSAPNMQSALDKALEGLKSIQNPVRRREVAELLFGSDQWATIASQITPAIRAQIKAMLGEIPAGSKEAADAFAMNMTKMGLSVERFRNEAIGPLLPEVNRLFDGLNRPETFAFIQREFDGVTKGVQDLLKELKQVYDFVNAIAEGYAKFYSGERSGGVTRNGIMPEASPKDVFANPEIAKRRQDMAQLQREMAVVDERIARKESQPDPLGGDAKPVDTEGRRKRDQLIERLGKLSDEIQALRRDGAVAQKSAVEGVSEGVLGGLIQKASLGGDGGGPGGSGRGDMGASRGLKRWDGVGTLRGYDDQGRPVVGGGGSGNSGGGHGRGAGTGEKGRTSPPTSSSPDDNVAFGMRGRYKFGPPDQPLVPAVPKLGPVTGRGEERLGPGNEVVRRGQNRVDPRLTDILKEASRYLPEGYRAKVISGFRPGDPRYHGRGQALDVAIYDPQGKKLPNYQNEEAFREYEKFAQAAKRIQMEKHPELNKDFRWGGYFSGPRGRYGAMDTMHFDTGGGGAMGGGSWEKGLTEAQRRMFPGAKSQGMGNVSAFRLPDTSRGGTTSAEGIDTRRGAPGFSGATLGVLDNSDLATTPTRSSGDAMMSRALGDRLLGGNAPRMEANGSVQIQLMGGLEKMPARVSMDGLFKDVTVNRGKQMEQAI